MIIFLNQLEHGIRVSILGSNGQPMSNVSRTSHALCNIGNCGWIRINIVT